MFLQRRDIPPRGHADRDIRKAYNAVKTWGFLEETLMGLNFCIQFHKLLITSVITPMCIVNINTDLCGYFTNKRGQHPNNKVMA